MITVEYSAPPNREATDSATASRRAHKDGSAEHVHPMCTMESKKHAANGLMNGKAAYHACRGVSSSVRNSLL